MEKTRTARLLHQLLVLTYLRMAIAKSRGQPKKSGYRAKGREQLAYPSTMGERLETPAVLPGFPYGDRSTAQQQSLRSC